MPGDLGAPEPLFLLPQATVSDPGVAAWFDTADPVRAVAKAWFDVVRGCGPDVRECLHDGRPTACIGDAAFAYVGAYTAHVAVGFFNGAVLTDPAHLLQGSGKRMRHVKLRWGEPVDGTALTALIRRSYEEMRARLGDANSGGG